MYIYRKHVAIVNWPIHIDITSSTVQVHKRFPLHTLYCFSHSMNNTIFAGICACLQIRTTCYNLLPIKLGENNLWVTLPVLIYNGFDFLHSLYHCN